MIYYLVFGLLFVLSLIVSQWLKSKFKKYSRLPLQMSGKEIAEKMLHDNGIYDVQVISTPGMLTDHYNPKSKTVNLSEGVYNQRNVAAAAVAAHECGHAIQHATSYAFLEFRSAMVPVVSFASKWVQWILLAGILLINVFPNLLLAGIILFAATTLFSFVTLPVEFNASKRALAWLKETNITIASDYSKAKDALNTAAMTYVIAAISSLATLLYYLAIFLGRRD
ncbi:MAG: zinc metallopeptidase [Lentimicrobiaceae bacterium]|nr:zinc metallopeptidase [Lentimicrobiaceae bacterium]